MVTEIVPEWRKNETHSLKTTCRMIGAMELVTNLDYEEAGELIDSVRDHL